MQERSLIDTLRSLQESGSKFVLVGGVAAVLNGAPIQTYDIDIVYSRTPDNIERLLGAYIAGCNLSDAAGADFDNDGKLPGIFAHPFSQRVNRLQETSA